MNSALVVSSIVTSVFIVLGFLLSRLFRRNDIADVLWGLGFFSMVLAQGMARRPLTFMGLLFTVLTGLWALRLSAYIGFRLIKKGEDIRYKNWRAEWGAREPLMAFSKIFVLQGLLMAVISIPLVVGVQGAERALTPWDFAGLCLYLTGFVFEMVADAQMAAFKKTASSGMVMNQGLWALCRHPNYLGETLIWWGFFLMAVSFPGGLFAIMSPLLITFLLTKVSGVPMLEQVLKEKGQAFKDYVLHTPAFIFFRWTVVLRLLILIVLFMVLDFLWLNVVMGSFYKTEMSKVARLGAPGEWDVLLWPALGVYVLLALSVKIFALSKDPWDSVFRGALLGLCIYGVYEFTNLSLVNFWSFKVALVDVIWGVALCGTTSYVGSKLKC